MTKNSVAAALPKGLSLFLCLALACPASLWANPVGGVVAGGTASIGEAGATVTVDQTTARAIIDWTSFSIGLGETTVFNQPDAASAILNRVGGGNPSEIYGSLQANGSVFLINPNGILVGASGVVDTNGFVASTLDLANLDFMGGTNQTFTGSSAAGVDNAGAITALGGDVIMIARTVTNTGTISAANGTAALAAGSEVLYKPLEDERVFVQAGLGASATGVDQAGAIQAAAAELKAAGGNVYSLAINNSGTINADQVGIVGGRIYLTAESGLDRGAVSNSGTLASTKGAFGGEVLLSGDQVAIEGVSSIAAGDLQVTGDTRILLNADVSTDGSQAYNGPVVLGGARALNSTSGDITFNGAVDSLDTAGVSDEYNLTATAGGAVNINAAIGATYALGTFDAQGAAIGLNADVTTSGYQTYLGAVDVGANAVLNAGSYVYFGGTVDSAGLYSLDIIADGDIDFANAVGGTSLGDLTLTVEPGSFGAVYFETTLDSDGAVVVNSDNVTEFWDNVGSRALGDLTVASEDYIWFYGTLDSSAGAAISLISPLDVGFDMAVGAASLGDLTIDGDYAYFGGTFDSDGSVVIDSSLYQVEFQGAVGSRALGDLTIASAADYIRFYDTLDSAAGTAISLTSVSDIFFDGAVGSVSLGDLTVDGAYVAFASGLDSDGAASVTASNWTDFYAPVGARALDSLSVASPAGIYFSGASVVTSGAQTYSGPASFASAGQFTSAGGAIDFLGIVDTSGNDLAVDAGAGAVTFGGDVAAGNLTVAGGDVRWDGALSGADVTVTGTNLTMNGDVTSTGANGVALVAANSFDNTSASTIDAGAARWLVYSNAPELDVEGGLIGDAEYGVSHPDAPAFAGSGFVYSSELPAAAASEPAASELDSFEASMIAPVIDVAGGDDSAAVDGGDDSGGDFGGGSDEGGGDESGSDGGSGDGGSDSDDGEKEKDGDK